MVKDGKLFGKINLFDATIVILIIVLVLAGFLKFKTFNETIDASELGRIEYEIAIYGVRDYTVDAFKSGDIVYDSGTNVNIGTIRKIETTPAQILKAMSDGTVKKIDNNYKNDIVLTIETPGTVSDTGYFANKSIEIKVGSEKEIETLYVTTYGKITGIRYFEK